MSIKVKFLIRNLELDGDPYGEETITSEDEIIPNIERYYSDLLRERAFDGGIISISSSDGSDNTIKIEDDLGALVQELCFKWVAKLAANEPVEIGFFTYAGKLSLSLENELVAISNNGTPKVKFLRTNLLPALYQCGERFVDVLRQVNDYYEPYYQLVVDNFDKMAATTRQALKEAKLI